MDVRMVYNEYNPKLVSSLPLKDPYFIAKLTQKDLFSGTLKEEVLLPSITQAEATSRFLCKAIERSLNIDDREPFDRLLLVMEGFNDPSLSKLAREIKQQVDVGDNVSSSAVTKTGVGDNASSSAVTNTEQLQGASAVATTKGELSSQKRQATNWANHRKHGDFDVDKIPAIVVDNGSDQIKAGFAGDDAPDTCFPSMIGRVLHQYKTSYIGDEASAKRDSLYLKYPIKHGIITDWDAMEMVWDYTFDKKLKVLPEEHAVLLTDNPINSKAYREKMAEIMFERFHTSGLLVVNQAILSLYTHGCTNGTIVQSGGGTSYIMPHAEDPLQYASRTLNLTGCDLNEYLMKLLNVQISDVSLCHDIKKTMCYVAESEKEVESNKSRKYELPDGKTIVIGKERYKCPEALFKPDLMGKAEMGIHQACYESIMKCDKDVHNELFGNIVLSGGNCLFPGMKERYQKEFTTLAPHNMKIKVRGPTDGINTSWIGGSILASLSNFQPLAVSKAQYEEIGPSVIRYHCFFY